MSVDRSLRIYETATLFSEQAFSGTKMVPFRLLSGSRLAFTLKVLAIDPATTVTLTVANGFSQQVPLDDLLVLSTSAAESRKGIVADPHSYFEATLLVAGGNADVAVGVTSLDNAMSTKIEQLDVELAHTEDSVASWSLDAQGNPITTESASVHNPIDAQIRFGGSAIDPRIVRALASATDSVTVFQGSSWSTTVAALDVALSTRASEATVAAILAKLDAQLSSVATQSTLATRASEATLASVLSRLDVALSTRASETTVASILAQLDVALSTRSSEITLASRASEATVASILAKLDVALSTRASEATLATRATEATVASILTKLDVALSTRASEATLSTRGTEATLATRASEATLASVLAKLDVALSTRATEATVASILTKLDVALSTRSSEATLASVLAKLDVALSTRATEVTLSTVATEIGSTSEAAATSDAATSGLNGLFRRLLGRFGTLTGELTETAPASDTASSGLNGRLQKVAQNLTTLTSALTARLGVLGQALMAGSTPVVLASDQIGKESTVNSSTATLGAGGVFTGTWEDVTLWGGFTLSVFSNVASATDGLSIQWSTDGVNQGRVEASSLNAGQNRAFNLAHRDKFFRIVYTNGGGAQGSFRLKVVHKLMAPGVITKPLDGSVTTENFAQLVQAAAMSQLADGSYVDIDGLSLGSTGLFGIADATAILADRGLGFFITVDSVSTGLTTERAWVLIDNPVGSGKILRFDKIGFGPPDSGVVIYRMYRGPTVTLNGAALTPVGARNTGQNAAVVNWYTLPTVTANGSKFKVWRTDQNAPEVPFDLESGLLLEPGNKLLITSTQSLVGQPGNVNVVYSEV